MKYLILSICSFALQTASASEAFEDRIQFFQMASNNETRIVVQQFEQHPVSWQSSKTREELLDKCDEYSNLIREYKDIWFDFGRKGEISNLLSEDPNFEIIWILPFGKWRSNEKHQAIEKKAEILSSPKYIAGPRKLSNLVANYTMLEGSMFEIFWGYNAELGLSKHLKADFDLAQSDEVRIPIKSPLQMCDILKGKLQVSVEAQILSDPRQFLKIYPTKERIKTLFEPVLSTSGELDSDSVPDKSKRLLLQGRSMFRALEKSDALERAAILKKLSTLRKHVWNENNNNVLEKIQSLFETKWTEDFQQKHKFEWIFK